MDILASGVVTPGNVVQVSEVISILGITSEVTQVSVTAEQTKVSYDIIIFHRQRKRTLHGNHIIALITFTTTKNNVRHMC